MTRIERFTLVQRLFHLSLMLAFVTQAATGLSRLYIETRWGRFLSGIFGGYESALSVHKWVGLFMLALFGLHIVYILFRINWRSLGQGLFGPDSLLPRPSDLGQLVRHLGWFLGLAEEPRFDRWGYWEKFDYWAVFWGMVIIGGSGLTLFDPVLTSRFLPGWGLNVALWVHRLEAILAMAHVFLIHFFIGHLRRSSFPMDLAMFEGGLDLRKARQERPAWVERLSAQGPLDRLLAHPAPKALRLVYYLFGFAVMIGCLYLLVNGLALSGRVTW